MPQKKREDTVNVKSLQNLPSGLSIKPQLPICYGSRNDFTICVLHPLYLPQPRKASCFHKCSQQKNLPSVGFCKKQNKTNSNRLNSSDQQFSVEALCQLTSLHLGLLYGLALLIPLSCGKYTSVQPLGHEINQINAELTVEKPLCLYSGNKSLYN